MYEDDTIRLFGVANILKNKKDKNDNWDNDDIPDIKHQPLTGKYDHNFDALGSDFQRAHQYNFNNVEQPENTKTDVNYDTDKYTRFLNYTPSKYIQLEEDEYKPIGKYNEKADEYYIDNLQGKTLDDMVIGKMKENAGANDLPKDAARRQFAENIVGNASRFEDLPEYFEEVSKTPRLRGTARRDKDEPQQDYTPEKIIIGKPIKLGKNGLRPIKTINTTVNMDGLGARKSGQQQNAEDEAVSNKAEEKVDEYFNEKKDEALGKLYRNKENRKTDRANNAYLDERNRGRALKRAFNKLRPADREYIPEPTFENEPPIVTKAQKQGAETPEEAVKRLIANKNKNPEQFQQLLKTMEQLQQNNPKEFQKKFMQLARNLPKEFKMMYKYYQQQLQPNALVKNSKTKLNTLGNILTNKSKGIKRVAFEKLKNNVAFEKLKNNQEIKEVTKNTSTPSQQKQTITNPDAAMKYIEKFFDVANEKQSPSGKSEKTDVASYMGSSSKSDLTNIKYPRGYSEGSIEARERVAQQKLEAGLPKYSISLEVVKKNYDGAKPETLISDVVKKEINTRTGKTFFALRDNITVKQATDKLDEEIKRRTKGSTLTADVLSQHNKRATSPGSPLTKSQPSLGTKAKGTNKVLGFGL